MGLSSYRLRFAFTPCIRNNACTYRNQKELGSSLPPSSSPLTWKGLEGLLTRLPWRGNHAELLQQAQCVHVEPMLDTLAAHDAVDVDCRNRRLLAGRGNTHKRTLLCSTRGQAGHDLVPFSDHVLNREVQIRESRQVHGDELFGPLDTRRQTGRKSVIDTLGVNEFLDCSPLLLVEHFLVETADDSLVFFS